MEWLIIIGLVVWLIAGSVGRKRRFEQIDQRVRDSENRLDRLERQLKAPPQPVTPAVAQPAATALGGASVFLRRREVWGALAEWVRSAAAAIFLFACAASGGLPGLGLQWIDAATPALALLFLGMAVNLYLSWTAAAQTFASL